MLEIKEFTYKMCFLYYNITGPIKIPAPTHVNIYYLRFKNSILIII